MQTMQKTKQEIIELVARALYGTWSIEKYDDLPEYRKDLWRFQAENALQALEDNGILTLVEGDAREGDIVKLGDWHQEVMSDADVNFNPNICITQQDYETSDKYKQIILRDNILAYHCAKE